MTPEIRLCIHEALDRFEIELPSWGLADTGTRFGKFLQDGAAIDLADKLADAGEVHKFSTHETHLPSSFLINCVSSVARSGLVHL